MEDNILILVGSLAGSFIAIISAFAFIFPTKEKVNADCSKCRENLYNKINKLQEGKADTSALQMLTTQYQEILTSVTRLTTKIEMMLSQEEKHKEL